jgi:probable F420-dependent oxidoreductase
MKIDAMAGSFASAAQQSRNAEDAGADGVATAEINHDPFFPLVVAALTTQRVELITSIAVAFARNPMTVALQARDLNDVSGGRFVLGLGSQIKPHITRRYSMPWSAPTIRMREFVLAVRSIWDAWRDGTPLRFEGEYYRHTLMPPVMVPEPTPYANPRIVLGAVNTGMARVAGAVADGLHCHGFCTPRWLETVIIPAVQEGLAESGRTRRDFEISCPVMVATGRDDRSLHDAVEVLRSTIAFYGSTPAYRPVLDLHGWGDLGIELHRCSVNGQWQQMSALVPDQVLEAFAVIAPWDELPSRLVAQYGGVVDRLMYALPFDTAPLDVLTDMIDQLHAADAPQPART